MTAYTGLTIWFNHYITEAADNRCVVIIMKQNSFEEISYVYNLWDYDNKVLMSDKHTRYISYR